MSFESNSTARLLIDIDTVKEKKIDQFIKCFQKEGERFSCCIGNCSTTFSGKTSAIKHLKNTHDDIRRAINETKNLDVARKTTGNIEIKCLVDVDQLWRSILSLIIFNAMPLRLTESVGFRDLIKPISLGLQRNGIRFIPNAKNTTTKLNSVAEKIRNQIQFEVNNKTVCVLADIASRFNRSIFSLSIAFWFEGRRVIRTLAMQTLEISQTGHNLFELVKEILATYNITLDHVFGVTTDNGKNLKKMIRDLDAEMQNKEPDSDDNDAREIRGNDEEEDEEEFNSIPNIYVSNDGDHFHPDIFDDAYFEDLLTSFRNEFPDTVYKNIINDICCAAHCLHLIVMDAFKSCPELTDIISRCRELAKKLRTPHIRKVLNDRHLKMALLDVKTRWSSLYKMVCYFFCVCAIYMLHIHPSLSSTH